MPINTTNSIWQYEHTSDPTKSIIKLELPHCILRLSYIDRGSQINCNTEIIFCPTTYNMHWDTCMITENADYKSIDDAKLRALELLNNYIVETKTAINQYLTKLITKD